MKKLKLTNYWNVTYGLGIGIKLLCIEFQASISLFKIALKKIKTNSLPSLVEPKIKPNHPNYNGSIRFDLPI